MIIVRIAETQYYAFLMDYYTMEITALDFTKLPDSAISTFTLKGQVYLATFNQINEVENLDLYEINGNGNQTLRWIQQMNLKSYFLSSELYVSSIPFYK